MRLAVSTTVTIMVAAALAACGSSSTPAGPGIPADYFKQNAADEAKLAQGCQDLFGNPKEVAALHGATAPGEYEWQPRLNSVDTSLMNCYLRGPDVGNVTYVFNGQPQGRSTQPEGAGNYASEVQDGHFTSAGYYRITLSSEQESRIQALLDSANSNVK